MTMNLKEFFFKYLWVVTLVLIFGVCYFAAGTLNAYLASKYLIGSIPAPGVSVSASSLTGGGYIPNREAIVQRNLFAVVIPSATPGAGENVAATEASLRAKLLGIIYFGRDSSWNRATMKMLEENRSEVFKVGAEVKPGVVMAAIEEKKARVRYASGREEEFSLEEEKDLTKLVGSDSDDYRPDIAKVPESERERKLAEYRKAMGIDNRIRQVSDHEFVIEQAVINESLQNLNSLLQDARLVPNLVGEGEQKVADGFRIFRIRDNSIFNKLGMRNGDVIKAINGVKMDNIERGFELLQQLRFEKHFTIDVDRQEQSVNFVYNVQ